MAAGPRQRLQPRVPARTTARVASGTCAARAPATKSEGGGSVSEAVYVIERESLKGAKQRRPAGDVPGRGAKVFGVAWDGTFGIVSAGEDKMVQINRGQDLLASG